MSSDTQLLEQFVECFDEFDDDGVVPRHTDLSLLAPFYAKLPARFPSLFEQLLTNYRWPEVHLRRLRLLPNPSGPGFDAFVRGLFQDQGLVDVLLAHGFIQFGRAVDGAIYDPICFDSRRRRRGGDCPVVRLNHESALLNCRIKLVTELAPTFRDLVKGTIEDAQFRGSGSGVARGNALSRQIQYPAKTSPWIDRI